MLFVFGLLCFDVCLVVLLCAVVCNVVRVDLASAVKYYFGICRVALLCCFVRVSSFCADLV